MKHQVTTHRKIDIYLTSEGEFSTEDGCDVGELQAMTLDELKTLIDKAGKKKRIDQPGFMLDSDTGIRKVIVTSLTKETYGEYAWVTQKTKRGYRNRSKENIDRVYLNTPANRKLLAQWDKLRKKNNALEKEMTVLHDKLVCFKLPPPKKALKSKLPPQADLPLDTRRIP